MALKVRELLQPAAKERQREAGGDHGNQFTGGKSAVSADLREAPKAPTEQRKSTAQAAKATGAYRWAAVITS